MKSGVTLTQKSKHIVTFISTLFDILIFNWFFSTNNKSSNENMPIFLLLNIQLLKMLKTYNKYKTGYLYPEQPQTHWTFLFLCFKRLTNSNTGIIFHFSFFLNFKILTLIFSILDFSVKKNELWLPKCIHSIPQPKNIEPRGLYSFFS